MVSTFSNGLMPSDAQAQESEKHEEDERRCGSAFPLRRITQSLK